MISARSSAPTPWILVSYRSGPMEQSLIAGGTDDETDTT